MFGVDVEMVPDADITSVRTQNLAETQSAQLEQKDLKGAPSEGAFSNLPLDSSLFAFSHDIDHLSDHDFLPTRHDDELKGIFVKVELTDAVPPSRLPSRLGQQKLDPSSELQEPHPLVPRLPAPREPRTPRLPPPFGVLPSAVQRDANQDSDQDETINAQLKVPIVAPAPIA